MQSKTRQWIEKLLGGAVRELVRVGFTVWAVRIFLNAAPKTPQECKGDIAGIPVNAAQVFAIFLVFGVGLGVPLLMKLGEKYLSKK